MKNNTNNRHAEMIRNKEQKIKSRKQIESKSHDSRTVQKVVRSVSSDRGVR